MNCASGVELPFDDSYSPDKGNVDKDGDAQMVNEISTKERLRPIRFNLDADIQNVLTQSEVYGVHPKKLVFDHFNDHRAWP